MGRTGAALAAALVIVLAASSAAGAGAPAERGGGCANATNPATQTSTGELAIAIGCLVNEERGDRGRRAYRGDRRLEKAAKKHNDKMVSANCFSHKCPGEPDLEGRIRNTGYLSGARKFGFAEDIGCAQTAEEMVAHWMDSRLHRRNILSREYKEIGVAASHGRVSKRCGENFATFTIVFAFRRG
jgi:uncharacterized protein YkwD